MVTSGAGLSATDSAIQGENTSIAPAELERLSAEYARTRDRACETLILHHQRLVKFIACRYLNNVETLEDLVQVGNIGLINALDRFNLDHGTRFSTYATPTILGEIKRHFRDKTGGIKIPRWLRRCAIARAAPRSSLPRNWAARRAWPRSRPVWALTRKR